jgi:hypothetical protein
MSGQDYIRKSTMCLRRSETGMQVNGPEPVLSLVMATATFVLAVASTSASLRNPFDAHFAKSRHGSLRNCAERAQLLAISNRSVGLESLRAVCWPTRCQFEVVVQFCPRDIKAVGTPRPADGVPIPTEVVFDPRPPTDENWVRTQSHQPMRTP